jgi:hypothetical protein
VIVFTVIAALLVIDAVGTTSGIETSYCGPLGTTAGLQLLALFQLLSTSPVHVAAVVAVSASDMALAPMVAAR